MGNPPLLVTMGQLERILLGQAAASDPWKAANDLRKQQEAAATGDAGAAGAPGDAAGDGGDAAAGDAVGDAVGDGDADVDMGDGGEELAEAGGG